ncbi:uncharacterized protein B0P05DRAFT_582358 [Gilbertella persicaria]|uniref:uncharacterized protein n=1 Tax=Gilbertella persicaria TaxID=101096 RepID=UPI00221E8035|nr:uncharacterized protein B0P05DRAFT_582358 [Gilbertella persicaria]KAI8047347.1 hypothetical protein B0P05DRAFT_582358 [Gilbertella persicaria]
MNSKRLSLGSHFLSSKKKGDLSDLFISFDKDHDGKISYSELHDMLHSAGVDSSSINMIKNQPNKSLDFEEFAQLMRPTLSDPHRMTSKQLELKEAFDAFDKDGDGVINVTELQAMMEKLGDKITIQEAQDLIKDVDLDKDGVVNFNEFCTMMGVKQPTETIIKRSQCTHHQHRFSIHRLFCSHK